MIPRIVIENTYGINIPKPRENEDQSRPPTAEEMLSAYESKNRSLLFCIQINFNM